MMMMISYIFTQFDFRDSLISSLSVVPLDTVLIALLSREDPSVSIKLYSQHCQHCVCNVKMSVNVMVQLIVHYRAVDCALTNWLILPVVICLSQRLSHACISTGL
jgi:hypothetical protein